MENAQRYRNTLQEERHLEMKAYMEEQARNTHPRLRRLMKNRDQSITDFSSNQHSQYQENPRVQDRLMRQSNHSSMLKNYIPQPPQSKAPRQYSAVFDNQVQSPAQYTPAQSRPSLYALQHPPNHDPYRAPPPIAQEPFNSEYHSQRSNAPPDGYREHEIGGGYAANKNYAAASKLDYADDLSNLQIIVERQIQEKNQRKTAEYRNQSRVDDGSFGGHSDRQNGDAMSMAQIRQKVYQKDLDDQMRNRRRAEFDSSNGGERQRQYSNSNYDSIPRLDRAPTDNGAAPLNRYTPLPAIQTPVTTSTSTHEIFSRSSRIDPNKESGQGSHTNYTGESYAGRSSTVDPNLQSHFQTDVLSKSGQSYVRGAMQVQDMQQWQKEEFFNKENKKARNQNEIQMVLRQQIAEKEAIKQKKIADQREEDRKEQLKIDRDQIVLKEIAQLERLEILKKEQAIRAAREKSSIERQASVIEKSPLKKPLVRKDSPVEEIITTFPFRSDSPPLPGQLKRMKEEGYKPKEPAAKVVKTEGPMKPKVVRAPSKTEGVNQESQQLKPLESNPIVQMPDRNRSVAEISRTPSRDNIEMRNENREILKQLEAIQRELRSEDYKLRRDMEYSSPMTFEREMDKIGIINLSLDNVIRTQTRDRIIPSAPKESSRGLHSSHYRRKQPSHRSSGLSQPAAFDSRQMFSPPPLDSFNIDEIERKNQIRLSRLGKKPASQADRDIIAEFMSRSASRSIPTSPSVFQPLPDLN